jgi:hypothetical protein
VEQGRISLKIMRPEQFEKIIEHYGPLKGKEQEFKFQQNIIKTWLMALLNDQQLFDLSLELVEFFNVYLTNTKSSKPTHNVKMFLLCKTKEKALEYLVAITEDVLEAIPEKRDFLRKLKKAIALEIPQHKFNYLILLCKIEFQISKV